MQKSIRKGFTLIELMVVVAIIGILAAIAIPNFMKMQAKSKQSEAKANLKAYFTSERAYYASQDTYTNLVSLLGFSPERGNRYCYDAGGGGSGTYQTRQGSTTGVEPTSGSPFFIGIEADTFKFANVGITSVMTGIYSGAVTTGYTGNFTGTATGNVDSDGTLDDWSISSYNRASAAASTATGACATGNNPAGEPCNDQNDVVY